jgi:hypothetical protein
MLAVLGLIVIAQMVGSRGGNIESKTSLNVYLTFSAVIVVILGLQWAQIHDQYQVFTSAI